MEPKQMIAVMEAALEGKTIQITSSGWNNWKDCENPCWDWSNYEYRVKPEPKLRPYANAQEFVTAMKEHGPYIRDDYFYFIANSVNDGAVRIRSDIIPYNELLEYQWQDGAPCGVSE